MANDNLDQAIQSLRKQSDQAAPNVDDAIEMLRRRSDDPQDEPMFRPPSAPAQGPGTTAVGPPNDPSLTYGPESEPEPEQGIMGKLVGRAFGTDVNDPMPWTRIGATIAGSVAGGARPAIVPFRRRTARPRRLDERSAGASSRCRSFQRTAGTQGRESESGRRAAARIKPVNSNGYSCRKAATGLTRISHRFDS